MTEKKQKAKKKHLPQKSKKVKKSAKPSYKNIFGERTCVTRFLFALWALATVSSLSSLRHN
jgi:hypothetical protein